MERDHTCIDDILYGLQSAIEKTLGKEAKIERHPVPKGDVRRTWADLTLARDLLGYEPRTTLEDGLRQFADWLQK